MSGVVVAVEVFNGLNMAAEMISAGSLIFNRLSELQAKREAEGRAVTKEDVSALMAEGDVKAALERAKLAAAKAAQDKSAEAPGA